jgi:hypothetical protein
MISQQSHAQTHGKAVKGYFCSCPYKTCAHKIRARYLLCYPPTEPLALQLLTIQGPDKGNPIQKERWLSPFLLSSNQAASTSSPPPPPPQAPVDSVPGPLAPLSLSGPANPSPPFQTSSGLSAFPLIPPSPLLASINPSLICSSRVRLVGRGLPRRLSERVLKNSLYTPRHTRPAV